MEAKDAVNCAKAYVTDLFREDGVGDLRLEEIEFDEQARIWNVTLGFVRVGYVRDSKGMMTGLAAALEAIDSRTRVYRVVRVQDEDGRVLSVKLRDRSRDAA
mgnify:CR=1 FL=1